MPGAGWSEIKPYHWRVIFMPWLDVIRRMQGRSTTRDWLDFAMHHAQQFGLQYEVKRYFWSHALAGYHPSIAAEWALEEWDI